LSSFLLCPCLADGPRGLGGRSAPCLFVACSTRLLGFVFDPRCFQVLVGRSFGRSACAERTVRGCLADSPRAPRGRSVIRGASLEVLVSFSDSPRLMSDCPRQGCGQSAIPYRTVHAAFADRPPRVAGQSARGWQLCSLVRFLPPSFMLPRVLQRIIPKTRG
jgi:hypothetical protein